MLFKLKGDPERGGEISQPIHFGYDFSQGAVEVKEAEIIEKLKGNSHFEVVSDAPKTPEVKASKPRKKAAKKKVKKVSNANENSTSDPDS